MDELVGMAAGMKSNTLAMEGQLRQRATLLDDTEVAMEHSLQQARKNKQRAKEIHGRRALQFVGCTAVCRAAASSLPRCESICALCAFTD